MNLSHLEKLESESIHIIREVASEFENPVMLYSIGKDSAVMLHLALKAFSPGKLPFKLLHVDTTWKFKEMIKFRDEIAKKYDLDLLVHINDEGVKNNIGPITHGSKLHTDVMKTQAHLNRLCINISLTLHLVELEEMKKNQEPKREYFLFVMKIIIGILKTKDQNYGTYIIQKLIKERV